MKAWREVIEPKDDVARGEFDQSEFAADLAEVVVGRGSADYVEAQKFFLMTHLTGGLKNLLSNALRRLSGRSGDPIIQLKTSFGGGKTHSLLALYHLFGGRIRAEDSSLVREVLDDAEAEFIPKVHTAVAVGTTFNALEETLWGSIARQLSASTGKPELYEMMRANDEAGISPGSELLKKMFAEAGACLVLIDELVAYGRKLRDGSTRCNMDNLMTFAQELTEAAKVGGRTLLVVTLPSSRVEEIGDAQGEKILRSLENIFRRVESVWSAATADEGYAIVRRRLFKECSDSKALEETCEAFFKMYERRRELFPSDARRKEYLERLRSCYPIHPQLFDFLYEQWTGVVGFQKTRGVLRLMAKVLHLLWLSDNEGALIMPGDIPLEGAVRDELTKLLKHNWGTIVDSEVDGIGSKAAKLDGGRFGKTKAARRITRTIFLGTAPGSRESMVHGLDEKEIMLGALQHSDLKNVKQFDNALSALKGSLYYLYSQRDRLWFGVTPTLRKYVDDKRETYSADDVDYEIEQHINSKWKRRPSDHINAVHIFPRGSAEVPDDGSLRLVVLSTKHAYDDKPGLNAAAVEAEKIWRWRGDKRREHQNMVLFMAASSDRLKVLDEAAREYMAWRAVMDEENLNLDDIQRKNGNNSLKAAQEIFEMKVSQAYGKLLAPETEPDKVSDVIWQVEDINCTTGDNFQAADEQFMKAGLLYNHLGENALKNTLDEYDKIWGEDGSVGKLELWDYFSKYCYLPRLFNLTVLYGAINRGAQAKLFVLKDDVLYKEAPVEAPIERSIETVATVATVEEPIEETAVEAIAEVEEIEEIDAPGVEPPKTYFHMDTDVDPARWKKVFKNCMEEVVSHFAELDGDIRIRLSVEVEVPDGIPSELEKLIEANCKDIGAKNAAFD